MGPLTYRGQKTNVHKSCTFKITKIINNFINNFFRELMVTICLLCIKRNLIFRCRHPSLQYRHPSVPWQFSSKQTIKEIKEINKDGKTAQAHALYRLSLVPKSFQIWILESLSKQHFCTHPHIYLLLWSNMFSVYESYSSNFRFQIRKRSRTFTGRIYTLSLWYGEATFISSSSHFFLPAFSVAIFYLVRQVDIVLVSEIRLLFCLSLFI